MSLDHFSHEHPLILKEELDANGDDKIVCYGCRKPIIRRRSAADVYICSSRGCDDFYLHKTCAELPKKSKHPMHDQHPLTLHARPPYAHLNFSIPCDVCNCDLKGFTYICLSCRFDSCVTCATYTFEDREFKHPSHKQHTLTLMQREALFSCDACGTEAKDLSYVCNSCQFWMHKSCASSSTTVEPNFHPHPLVLTYSLPHIHRTFTQFCRICEGRVLESYWLYYCHKCTYFVHIKCVASSETSTSREKDDTEVEPQRDVDEHNLVQFPVTNEESFMNLIIDQFAKGNINVEEGEASPDQPQIINHWSHRVHPLILLEELQRSENNEMLICNGCVQPISTAHPFYGRSRCNFFLHRFCVELPMELPAGAYSCHLEHPLLIYNNENKFYIVRCDACGLLTNGFYFWCKTCKKKFDIGCCFLPNRIKHESHNHPLVNCASSNFRCRACGLYINFNEYFKCETACSNFQIHKKCAYLFPSITRHRWDPHPIPLIYPPFPHEGVIYCEICEEEIDPNYWLYHCSECDQSFHKYCLRPLHNIKLGDKEVVGIHPHTLTFVPKKKSVYPRPLLCCSCGGESLRESCLIFECANCDILFCTGCVFE